jgi:phosphatidylserine decarboxylase
VFAREGYPLIAAAAGFALLCAAVGFGVWGGLWLTGLGLVVLGFVVWFFRDPPRTPPEPAVDLLLAPADGKVIEIVEEPEPLYLDGPARRISIFLSPLNVHVNRSPATGIVEYQRYVPGEYLVAWHPKASEKNERSEVGLRHPSGTRVLFKQIAGAVARRIVFDAPIGKPLAAGERYGIVKFGSRMDIAVPPHVQITATIGQRVTAGETVLGSFSAPPPAARPPR